MEEEKLLILLQNVLFYPAILFQRPSALPGPSREIGRCPSKCCPSPAAHLPRRFSPGPSSVRLRENL